MAQLDLVSGSVIAEIESQRERLRNEMVEKRSEIEAAIRSHLRSRWPGVAEFSHMIGEYNAAEYAEGILATHQEQVRRMVLVE